MAGTEEVTAKETATEGRETRAEVEQMKSKYGDDCKVIENVGVFTFVVSVQIHGKDLLIKFQIDGTYPQVAPNLVVRSGQMSDTNKDSLLKYIEKEVAELSGTPMLDPIINLTVDWLEENELDLSIKEPRIADPRRKQKSKRKEKAAKKTEVDEVSSKKPPMKTADEVISRILWDDDLPNDCFTVGYLDRFVGVVEENFTTLSWDDIASVDYNTLVIPKHRIQYFKYKGATFWDKKMRLDDMFGSTGSGVTITDVIRQWEEEHPYVTPAQCSYSDDDDDDDDDDGVVIQTGYEDQTDLAEEDQEDLSNPSEPYWGVKIRPTHFLALRITDPTIKAEISEAHKTLIQMEPMYEECVLPTERLHMTLACLGLDTEEQVNLAVRTLEEIKSELASVATATDISVEFEDVDNFFHTTLYVKVKENPELHEFVQHLKLCLTEAGVHLRDIFDFVPHMTLLKLSRQLARDSRNPFLDPRVYNHLKGKNFGSQIMNNIYLCSMGEARQEDGFYVCPTSVHFD